MSPIPDWVKALKPAGQPGPEILQEERNKSNISVERLKELIHGKEALEREARILPILQGEKIFDKSPTHSLGRVERIQLSLAKGKRIQQLREQHKWSNDDFMTAYHLLSEPTPYGLHATMFLVTLRNQTTKEQKKLFLEPAEKYQFIGCYAQTELGHGSNVRGLETTATWNPDDKTFTIHSPSLTASKWWIGSLGKVANHAVVMAQLYVGGKNVGPHPFVVQIRDLKTHEPLEGVHVGDVGPKYGYTTMDNGFLLFNNYKVPHISMLARIAKVDPETNKYVRLASPMLVYGTMTWVRSSIVHDAGSVLARGVAIATRYCSIRKQFQDLDNPDKSGAETPVIDYSMVQVRLLPLLATTFALSFTGQTMMNQYNYNQTRLGSPEGQLLMADLHATSCGLKALGSNTAVEGLEMCRKTCGGHGYSSYSGIGPWYADYLPNITWEGDNYMLTQQVARYLLKSARAVLNGIDVKNDTSRIFKAFLGRRDCGAAFHVLGNEADIVDAFAWRSSYLSFEALKSRDVHKRSWNSLLIDFWHLSTAHSQYIVVKNFYDAVNSPETAAAVDAPTLDVLKKLFRLYALTTLDREAAEFYTSGALTIRQITLNRNRIIMNLLSEVRPHAIRLVDSWGFPDWQLDSSLGRADGRVYEDLFQRASEQNPVNDFTFDPYPWSSTIVKAGVSKL